MRQPPDKRQLTLWLAVGGTTAVIAVLWALQLPTQLERIADDSRGPASRWMAGERPAEEKPESLQDVLAKQRAEIERLQKEQDAASPLPTPTPEEQPTVSE